MRKRDSVDEAPERDPQLCLVDPLAGENAAGEIDGGLSLDVHPAPVRDLDLYHRRRCVPVASACSR